MASIIQVNQRLKREDYEVTPTESIAGDDSPRTPDRQKRFSQHASASVKINQSLVMTGQKPVTRYRNNYGDYPVIQSGHSMAKKSTEPFYLQTFEDTYNIGVTPALSNNQATSVPFHASFFKAEAVRPRQCDCRTPQLYQEAVPCSDMCKNTPPTRQRELIEELIQAELEQGNFVGLKSFKKHKSRAGPGK